jgi:pimeloyl-ACP methyl ester carboxylesterase
MRILLLAAAAALAVPMSAVSAAPAAQAQMAEVRLPHISIIAEGQGSPVVLIPGLSSPRATWDRAAAALRGKHRLILVQVNGFAGDEPGANLQPGILKGIGDDLSAYLEREKIGPVQLVGHSMGGLTALLFASAHPDQVKSLMIVDALPFFPVLMDPNATAEQAKPIAAMMRDKVAAAYGKPVDEAAVEANVRSLSLKPASLALTKQWAAKADPRVTAGAVYEDMITDARPLLPAIKAPITVVVPWSEAAFGRERTLAFYAKQYAGAAKVSYADIGDAGHFVMLDQPQAFEAALETFLAK